MNLSDVKDFLHACNWQAHHRANGEKAPWNQEQKSFLWQNNITRANKGEKVIGSSSIISERAMRDRFGAEINTLLIGLQDYCARNEMLLYDIILHIENPKDSTEKVLQTINKYNKVAVYKISVQKSMHSDILMMKFQKRNA